MLSDGLFTAARRRLRARKNAASCGNGFNSQPPEGGWRSRLLRLLPGRGFNSQPREGGWPIKASSGTPFSSVSTHSRTKAAGHGMRYRQCRVQLTAARRRLEISPACTSPSVVFQLTAARRRLGIRPATSRPCRCFNSQPPEGGWPAQMPEVFFQIIVSTHSRPKAAGKALREHNRHGIVSTHSRPKAAGI